MMKEKGFEEQFGETLRTVMLKCWNVTLMHSRMKDQSNSIFRPEKKKTTVVPLSFFVFVLKNKFLQSSW